MLNIIGEIPPRERVLGVPGAHLHLYGKSPNERRKLGHVTLVADDAAAVDGGVAALSRVLGAG
jgi:5-(carboxyamino)imidazole ribonucleotide synthase